MHPIPAQLHLGATGPEVANLQELLMSLINSGTIGIGSDEIVNLLATEHAQQLFGSATVDAVRLYQNMKNLAFSTPVLDWATLNSLNAGLSNANELKPVVLTGNLRNEAGGAVQAAYQIRLYKAALTPIEDNAEPWMQTTSDANGGYSFVVGNITDDAAQMRGYQIRAVNPVTGVSYRTLTTYLTGAVQRLDVLVSDAEAMPGYEYNMVLDETNAALTAVSGPALPELDLELPETRSYLEAATGESIDKIRNLADATRLSQKLGNFNPGFLYALARFNVSMNPAVLTTLPDEVLTKAAINAFGSHIIPSMSPEQTGSTISSLRSALFGWLTQRGTATGADAQPQQSATFRIFNKILNNPERTNRLLKAYFAYDPGNGVDFWKTLLPDPGVTEPFQPSEITDLKLAALLAIITGSNPALVFRLFRILKGAPLEGDPALAGTSAASPLPQLLANFNASQWFTIISHAKNQDPDNFFYPDFVTGVGDGSRIENYAARLDQYTDEIYPTNAISRDIIAAPESPFTEMKQGFSTFITNNPGFDLRTTPYSKLAADSAFSTAGIENKAAFIEEVGTVQRLMNLSPQHENIAAMADKGYTSSMKISRTSLDAFKTDLSGSISAADATTIFNTATSITDTILATTIDTWVGIMNDGVMPKNTNWDGISADPEAVEDAYAEWRALFGSLDSCNCSECQSVYSASAYFTDTMNFMETQISADVFAELAERRRPDLRHIRLTCKNANTAVPQIDIINEMLEDLISNQHDHGQYGFYARETTAPAAQQRALPEHVNTGGVSIGVWNSGTQDYQTQVTVSSPYPLLKSAVYPWSLPYNFYKRQIDNYLAMPGVSGHELMQRYGGNDKLAAWDDMAFCTTYLGISAEQMAHIATPRLVLGTSYEDLMPYYGFKRSGSTVKSIPDPAKRGSSIPVSLGSWILTLGSRVDIFLQQTGLSYPELLQLLDCYSINPRVLAVGGIERKIRISPIDPVKEASTCQLDRLSLLGLDANVLQLLYRFVQMSRVLGWSFYDLDRAFTAFAVTPPIGTIRPAVFVSADVRKLVQLKRIVTVSGLSVEQACLLYTDIDQLPYRDYTRSEPADLPNTYERIFRNPLVFDVNSQDFPFDAEAKFTTPVNRNVLLNYLAGVLNISQQDLLEFPSSIIPNTATVALSLSRLSAIYREAMLIRLSRYSVHDWFRMKTRFSDPALFGTAGTTAFDKPIDFALFDTLETIRLIEFCRAHQETGISSADLDFLLEDKPPDAAADERQHKAMATTLMSLHADLRKRWPGADYDAGTDTDGATLRALLQLVMDSEQAQLLVAVIQDTARFSISDPNIPDAEYSLDRVRAFINRDLKFLLPAASDEQLVVGAAAAAAAPTYSYISSPAARRGFVYERVRRYVSTQSLKPAVVSTMGKHFKADEKLVAAVLGLIRFSGHSGTGLDELAGIVNQSAPVFDRWAARNDYMFETMVMLSKALLLIGAFRLNADEIAAFWEQASPLPDSLRLTDLPFRIQRITAPAPAPYRLISTFFRWASVRDFLAGKSKDLFEAIGETYASLSKSDFLDRLRLAFKMSRPDTDILLDSGASTQGVLNTAYPADYRKPELYLRIRDALEMQHLLPASMEALAKIAGAIQSAQNQDDANEIIHVVKAQYSMEAWLEAVRPVSDKLRTERRDAMLAYLLANPPHPYENTWYTSNDIFETLLIDVEMSPCMPTTRILLGINSLQLWMDRVLMGLEKNTVSGTGLKIKKDPGRQWASWRKRYRIWEANRKIFIYPENWIEPELRDDKTPLFTELEKFLKQNEVTKENVELAYSTYLERLDELAHLDIIGVYRETKQRDYTVFMYNPGVIERDVVHVFGRTPAHPHIYYYRKRIGDEWTAWMKMDVQIDGEHFIPVFWRGRLRLYWLTFMKEQQTETATRVRTTTMTYVTPPSTNYKINLAWTELKNGSWTAKQVSKSALYSMKIEEEDVVDHVHLAYFVRNDASRMWYPAGTLDRQLKERFYFYNTLDGDGNLLFELQEKVVRTSSPMLNSLLYENTSFFSSLDLDDEQQFIPDRLREIDNIEACNEVKRSGTGSFLVSFNDVKSSRNFRQPVNMFQPFFLNSGRNPNALESNGYSGSHTDLRYLPTENKPQTGSGYFHFPNNVKLLDRAPDTDLSDKPKGKYLVFPREVHQDYTEGSMIRIPYFFYKDNDNSFFVEEVHVSTGESTGSLAEWFQDNPKYVITTDGGVIAIPSTAGNGGPRLDTGGGGWKPVGGLGIPVSDDGSATVDFGSGYQIFYRFHNFYHNRVYDFRQKLFESGIEGLLDRNYISLLNDPTKDTIKFAGTYQPTIAVMQKDSSGRNVYPTNNVDFSYDAAFSTYNWEIFFHIPLLIANKLSQNQQFADARTWYQYIFNPSVANDLTTPTTILDFWNFEPFYQRANNVPTIYQIMNDQNLKNAVERWANDPFKPHLVARTRITAYMKATVIKYLDNLIAWGDALFRTDSREDIVEATLLYVLAAQLLGRRPTQIPPRAIAAVQTYASLKAATTLNAFSNAMVKIESYLLTSGTTPGLNLPLRGRPGAGTETPKMYMFCIPPNSKLTGYWDIIADRLFKIRNCQNIDGVTRDLALYDPPIDPALLVKAAAAGISATDALAAANAPLPLYRFQVLAQKATEIAGEVKALGSQLLSALEKKDAEKLSRLRSSQELRVLDAVTELKQKSIEEAAAQINGLDQQRKMVTQRRSHYHGLIDGGLNREEQLQLDSIQESIPLQIAQGGTQALASTLFAIPEFHLGPFLTGLRSGGQNLGHLTNAAAAIVGVHANVNSAKGSMAGIKGGYQRRSEEWAFQVKSADTELLQLDKQVIAAQIRMAMAEADLKNHKLQAQNTLEMDEAMRSKYTNEELYDWMIGQISYTYMSAYKLALSMAMKAERCYQNELNTTGTSFISATYWDSLYKGLMAGEGLAYDIKRMEASYLDKNKRQLELSKHISLAALDPKALMDLKSKRSCTLRIPEWAYDMDYPGHHMRRIKSVSISIPCVAGPYTTVSCKLSLLKSKYRISGVSTGAATYAEAPVGNDDRFKYVYGNIQSIATSHGQNDSGMFDFSFRDERYLPFEGAGAISEWEIKLPAAYAQFDRDSIFDVILHINYTALDEGSLAADAGAELDKILTEAAKSDSGFMSLFSLKQEFADAWYAYGSNFATNPAPLSIVLNHDMYPLYAKDSTISVRPMRIIAKWKRKGLAAGQKIALSYWNGTVQETIIMDLTKTVSEVYSIFDGASGLPLFTVDTNPRQLKLTLQSDDTALNMDELFEELCLVNVNWLGEGAEGGTDPGGDPEDPDWGGTPSLPTLPTGAKAWWMADAGITRDQVTGNVVSWSDMSQSGHSLQYGSTLQQPLYDPTGGPNSKPCLSFDGTRSMSCASFNIGSTSSLTVFSVFRLPTSFDGGVIVETSTNFMNQPGAIAIATNDGYNNHVETSHKGNMGFAVGGQYIPFNQWSYVRYENDLNVQPPQASSYVNGGAQGTLSRWIDNSAVNTGTFASGLPLFFGSRNHGAPFLTGDVAEFIIYDRRLSPQETAIVESYLKSKYNL